MCLALNVQWSSQSNAAMLSMKSDMMRWHESVPLSIPRSARLRWRKSVWSPRDTSAPQRPLSSARMSSGRRVTITPSSAPLSIRSMIFPNQTEFGLEFSGHWQWSSKFSKPIWIWFGICVLQNQFFSFQTKLELVWKILRILREYLFQIKLDLVWKGHWMKCSFNVMECD